MACEGREEVMIWLHKSFEWGHGAISGLDNKPISGKKGYIIDLSIST